MDGYKDDVKAVWKEGRLPSDIDDGTVRVIHGEGYGGKSSL